MGQLNKNLVIKRIGLENCDEVLDLIKNHYTNNTVDYRMLQYDLEEQSESDAVRATTLLSYGLSVGIFEKNTNRLVATTLNAIVELGKPAEYNPTTAVDPKIGILCRLIDHLEDDVPQLLEAEKILFMNITTVMSEYQMQGLSKQMNIASIQIAKENKCEYIVATATTSYFPKSIGYKLVKQVKYSDYVDVETGLRPFKDLVIEPHTHATVFAFQVSNSS